MRTSTGRHRSVSSAELVTLPERRTPSARLSYRMRVKSKVSPAWIMSLVITLVVVYAIWK